MKIRETIKKRLIIGRCRQTRSEQNPGHFDVRHYMALALKCIPPALRSASKKALKFSYGDFTGKKRRPLGWAEQAI